MKRYILIALCYSNIVICSEQPKQFTISRSVILGKETPVDLSCVQMSMTVHVVTTLQDHKNYLKHQEYVRCNVDYREEGIRLWAVPCEVSSQKMGFVQQLSLKPIMDKARKKYFNEEPTGSHRALIKTISFDQADLDEAGQK